MTRRKGRTAKKRSKRKPKTIAQRVSALEKAIKGPKAIAHTRAKHDMTPPHIRRQLGL